MKTLEKSIIDRLKLRAKKRENKQKIINEKRAVYGLNLNKKETVNVLLDKKKNKMKERLIIDNRNQWTPITSIENELGTNGTINKHIK